jgi:phosphoglycerate dehydrogenase-like enzyme
MPNLAQTTPVEVLVTLPFPDDVLAPLREFSPEINLNVHAARRPEDVPGEVWAKIQVLYTDRVLPSPAMVPALRWLQFHSAGIDFAIGSPLLQKAGLAVTTLSGAAAAQTAEYALAMLLGMGHHFQEIFTAQQRAEWPRERFDRFRPQELRGSTVGLIGYGSIGRELARLLQPFNVQILAVKHNAMHPEDRGYTAEGLGDPAGHLFTRLYPPQALRSVLKLCDYIVVTTPLTPATQGMIGTADLACAKPGACVLVVGRGGTVDEAALLEALQEKRIAAAALDVFREEPLGPTSPLWKQPNLLLTPHIAGMSQFYDQRAMSLFATNLRRFLDDEELLNCYDPDKGY